MLTQDEEQRLPACLESLSGWVERLIVVDSGSTDGTLEIARGYGAEIVHHPFESYGAQRNWALRSLQIASPWVINVDADERVTPELRESIRRALGPDADPSVDGYLVSRRTVFMNRWIRYGGHYPAWHLRLFRDGRGRCEERLYDQHFVTAGRVEKLSGDLIDTFGSDIGDFVRRHTRWASLEAQEQTSIAAEGVRLRGKIIGGNPMERRRWWRELYHHLPLFVRPTLYFLYRYVFRLGCLDGRAGLVFHFLQGFWYRFLIDALIVERRLQNTPALGGKAEPNARTDPPE